MVSWLLKNGSNVSQRDNDGWTAFHLTAQEGNIEIAEILKSHDGDVNAQKSDG